VRAGAHEISAVLDEATGARTLRVEGGETSITISLEEPSAEEPEPPPDEEEPEAFEEPRPEREGIGRLHHGFFWGGLGGTVASGVVLAVVGARLVGLREDWDNLPASATEEEENALREDGETYESATTAMWVVTGVFAAATIVLGIFTDWSTLRRGGDDDEASRLRWSIAVGQGASFQLNF
jgi:hypothetical protein